MQAGGRIVLLLIVALVLSACAGRESVAPVGHRDKSPQWHPKAHIVRRGDTLYSIAFRYGHDYREVAAWNGIGPPYLIDVGQRIRLEPPPARSRPQTKSRPRKPSPARPTAGSSAGPSNAGQAARSHSSQAKAALVWRWPARGAVVGTFSGRKSGRHGLDIGGHLGEPVYAAAPGRVVYSGSGLRGYGKLIIVKHNERFLSAYAHNRRLLVKEGDRVKAGQPIAEMGKSGSRDVMLHFEIRQFGKPVDPLRYLPKRSS